MLRCNTRGVALTGVNSPRSLGISAELWAMLSEAEKRLIRDAPPPAPPPPPCQPLTLRQHRQSHTQEAGSSGQSVDNADLPEGISKVFGSAERARKALQRSDLPDDMIDHTMSAPHD